MRVAHFRHSCLLVEIEGAKILFDPGTFSHGFGGITDLDAVFITHQHPDHADTARLPALIDANPNAKLFADPQTAEQLGDAWTAVRAGDVQQIGNAQITGDGGEHAVIHPEIPVVDNTVYLVGTASHANQLMHPGDSLYVPNREVDILALPAAAPWMKLSETVEYLRAVKPRLAFPIHQEVAAADARGIYYSRFDDMKPSGTDFRVLPEEESLEL